MNDFTRHAQLKKQAKSHGWVAATASAASISASSSSVCHTFHIYCFRRCVNLLQKSFTTVGRRKLRESGAKHFPQMERFVDKCCWRQATLRAIWQERFRRRARKTDGAPSFDRKPLRRRNRPVLTWTDSTRRLDAVASSCLLARQHVAAACLYLRAGGEAGGRGMCDWQEIPQKDSLFLSSWCVSTLSTDFYDCYWFPLTHPSSEKQPRFLRGLQDLAFQRCYYHSAGQTVRMRSGRAHSFWNMQKHTCIFFFTHAFKILWDLITFVFISTNRTTALHDLSTSHSLPLFEWIAVPLLYFDNTFSIFSQQPSSHVTQWLHTSVWLCCYSR